MTGVCHLVGVDRVLPGHVEHVSDLLCQADTGATVGGDVDARDATLTRHLRRLLEEDVLLRPERADLVGDVVAYHNDLTARRVLGRPEGHPPRHHANLQRRNKDFYLEHGKRMHTVMFHFCEDFSTLRV